MDGTTRTMLVYRTSGTDFFSLVLNAAFLRGLARDAGRGLSSCCVYDVWCVVVIIMLSVLFPVAPWTREAHLVLNVD